ncbi:SNF2 family N-terminal domain-containing protein [Xylaria arbuscula]|nr:SNF2 family N-terminal domain-containing protein [Xylaria arbuscula]
MNQRGFKDSEAAECEVCYGALNDAVAKVLDKIRLSDYSATNDTAEFTNFDIRKKGDIYMLISTNGCEFAVIDNRTVSRLRAVSEMPMLRFEAVVQSNVLVKRQRRAKHQPRTFPLSINIFGLRLVADDIASRLSAVSAYLQHPRSSLHAGVIYHNPQLLTFLDEDQDMSALVGTGNGSSWELNTRISDEVGIILESLAHADIAADRKLELPVGLTSKLKEHQENGLRFILQREEEPFSQMISAWLREVTSIQARLPSSMSFGGLIADAMGLGKTLTMLTAILQSMPMARDFSDFDKTAGEETSKNIRTQATLVVVSSAQILESWISEIRAHFSPGALSWICFHGQDRPRDPENLRSVGIVLTTYATLAADTAGRRTLYQMSWYRVVLDEAHWIRNSTSKQFKATASLDSRSRWCLTGTPIQNKLEDLASLAQFLKLQPLTSVTHILATPTSWPP